MKKEKFNFVPLILITVALLFITIDIIKIKELPEDFIKADNIEINETILIINFKGDSLEMTISESQASSINSGLTGKKGIRPNTHDLFLNTLNALNMNLYRVSIDALRESYYTASLHVSFLGISFIIDSRPSDAIALALRANATIYVNSELFYKEIKLMEIKRPEVF